MIVPGSGQPTMNHTVQVRRAWLVVGVSFALFAACAVVVASAGVWVYQHATEPEIATLEVISGRGALLRSPSDSNWRFVTSDARIREGDRVSTALGTVVTVTLFDGSTVEVTENTDLRVTTMRSSRFLRRTKLVVLEPLRGTIYVSMAKREPYRFSETIVRQGTTRVSMVDGEQQPEAGSFLVEARDRVGQQAALRVAVLSGTLRITTLLDSRTLDNAQQVEVDVDGSISAISDAVRELLTNGDFGDGLNGWIEFQREPNGSAPIPQSSASVDLVSDLINGEPVTSVEFLRSVDDANIVDSGIRQRIGTTLRVYSSLVLDLEVKISDQMPVVEGAVADAFPLMVEINYVDLAGAERRWQHGYYARDNGRSDVPDETATELDRGEWQRVVFDLRNLDPRPRQVTSIVVYASGQRYATRVANLSLSSSELDDPESR